MAIILLSAKSCREDEKVIKGYEHLNGKIDSCVQYLKSGDVVLRSGRGFTSTLLSNFNKKNKTYSHAGVLIVEAGVPYIYHCIGGDDNPDAVIRKDVIQEWCSPLHNTGFGVIRYSIDSIINNKVISIIRGYYEQNIKFDLDFDLLTDSNMYCTEMVYKAFTTATSDSKFISLSTAMNKSYVSVDNLYLNPSARFVCQIRFK